MFHPTCPELIGVCGMIASGKSYAAQLIARTYGFKYVNTDILFKEKVRPDPEYIEVAEEFFRSRGVSMRTSDGSYNTEAITSCLFPENDPQFTNLAFFNAINRPFLLDALTEACSCSGTVLVEMATLPAVPEVYHKCLFSVYVSNGTQGEAFRKARLLARDSHRDDSLSYLIDKAQRPAFYHAHQMSRGLQNWDNGQFLDDAEILRQFDVFRTQHLIHQ